ncbi:MAG: 3-hydroxyacyl-ACP dehydratase [Ferruginibacter sp.]
MEKLDGKVNVMLEINAAHKIFEGHFPGQPVVPGVCMMQIVKEVLEEALDKATRLISADNLKFLSIIDPFENNMINVELKYNISGDGEIKVVASLVNDAATYFKMSGVFVLV